MFGTIVWGHGCFPVWDHGCVGPAVWDYGCLGPPFRTMASFGPSFGTMNVSRVWEQCLGWDRPAVWDHRAHACLGPAVWDQPVWDHGVWTTVWDHIVWDHRFGHVLGPSFGPFGAVVWGLFGTMGNLVFGTIRVWDHGLASFGTIWVFNTTVWDHAGVWEDHGCLAVWGRAFGATVSDHGSQRRTHLLFGTMGVWDHCLGPYRLGPSFGTTGPAVWDHTV